MMFWFFIAFAAVVIGWTLVSAIRASRARGVTAQASDIAVYKDQLAELDRDLERGVLTPEDADIARIEVSRRLLEANKRESEKSVESSGQTGIAIGLVLVTLASGAGLYFWQGAPGYDDLPIGVRLAELEQARAERPTQAEAESVAISQGLLPPPAEADAEFLELMDRLREAVAERPDDVQGLTLLANYEGRLGNFAAAREAQEKLVSAKGDETTAADLVTLVDIMVFAAAGLVSPEAEAVLERAHELEPNNGAAWYYRGLLEVQSGRPDRAFPIWRQLLESSPPAAPWVPIIEAEISAVAAAAGVSYSPPRRPGPTQDDIAAAEDMSAEDREAMIRGMVGGLADRLATEGGPPQDWARLISALGVLGETAQATEISQEALAVFAGDNDALALIRNAMRNAGLAE